MKTITGYIGPITCMESMVKEVHLQIDLASHQEALLVLVVTRNGWLNHLYINHC